VWKLDADEFYTLDEDVIQFIYVPMEAL